MSAAEPLLPLSGAPVAAERWCQRLAAEASQTRVLLLLGGTDTAAVPGISAAGATPESRRYTAAADAEYLLRGPHHSPQVPLPELPAGVSPAVIARAVVEGLALEPWLVDLGVPVPPAVPHLSLGQRPARCLSTGQALGLERTRQLWQLGRRWGERLARSGQPILLAECVPGGTTTALAVLEGLGIRAAGLVSGSQRQPDHQLKARLVAQGLEAAGLQGSAEPERVLAALGDPMQPLAAGVVQAAAQAGTPLLLAGGSQMAAVLAVALAATEPSRRPELAAQAAVVTTAWLAQERSSNLSALLARLGERWGVEPLGFAAALRFSGSSSPELQAYEQGFVKEGVGAGGLAALWQLSGRGCSDLVLACEQACHVLRQT